MGNPLEFSGFSSFKFPKVFQEKKRMMRSAVWILICLLIKRSTVMGCSVAGCSGHGMCDEERLTCSCYDGFTGPDCARRVCPGGPTWVGFANGTNDVHSVIAECSNMGTCNEKTGMCTCDTGFEGFACERMSCPEGTGKAVCSGHGRCLTLEIMALTNDGNHLEYNTNYNEWDADRIQGCACDHGWEGYDCSERADCPLGDDPFTLGQVDEVQVLDCTHLFLSHILFFLV